MSDTPVISLTGISAFGNSSVPREKAHVTAAEAALCRAGRDRIDAHVGIGENGLILPPRRSGGRSALLPARPVAEVIEGISSPTRKRRQITERKAALPAPDGIVPALERMHPAALRAEEERRSRCSARAFPQSARGFSAGARRRPS